MHSDILSSRIPSLKVGVRAQWRTEEAEHYSIAVMREAVNVADCSQQNTAQ